MRCRLPAAAPRRVPDQLRRWLRKFYPEGTDEPHYAATPAAEKALQWIQSPNEREFVGTESRLKVIFDLLRQFVLGTETDPGVRLEELTRPGTRAHQLLRGRKGNSRPLTGRGTTARSDVLIRWLWRASDLAVDHMAASLELSVMAKDPVDATLARFSRWAGKTTREL
ncbi:MAG: DUF3375 family protein, partial [Frankiaceae bacterium]